MKYALTWWCIDLSQPDSAHGVREQPASAAGPRSFSGLTRPEKPDRGPAGRCLSRLGRISAGRRAPGGRAELWRRWAPCLRLRLSGKWRQGARAREVRVASRGALLGHGARRGPSVTSTTTRPTMVAGQRAQRFKSADGRLFAPEVRCAGASRAEKQRGARRCWCCGVIGLCGGGVAVTRSAGQS